MLTLRYISIYIKTDFCMSAHTLLFRKQPLKKISILSFITLHSGMSSVLPVNKALVLKLCFSNHVKPQENGVITRSRSKGNHRAVDNVQAIVQSAVSHLKQGHVIAVPTDTVYGLAALVQNRLAVDSLYNIKQRDPIKPIAICVSDIEDIDRWSEVIVSRCLLQDLLPGPVTVVFKRRSTLNQDFNPDTDLVGVRIPDHAFIRDLCRECGEPIALTSANISSSQSTLAVQEFSSIWSKLDLIVDGGVLGNTPAARLGSTVVNLSLPGHYQIIRDGSAKSETVATLKKHGLTETEVDFRVHQTKSI